MITDTDIITDESKKLLERLKLEPAYTKIMYNLLEYAKTGRTAEELFSRLKNISANITLIQSPSTIIKWLVDLGGINPAGKSENKNLWQTSKAGLKVLNEIQDTQSLEFITQKNDPYRKIYTKILKFCLTPKNIEEIENNLDSEPLLKDCELQTGYFIGKLEDAGALEWQGKWVTTNSVKTLIQTEEF